MSRPSNTTPASSSSSPAPSSSSSSSPASSSSSPAPRATLGYSGVWASGPPITSSETWSTGPPSSGPHGPPSSGPHGPPSSGPHGPPVPRHRLYKCTRHDLCECCHWITTRVPIPPRDENKKKGVKAARAGVFLFNKKENKILVVQTYNEFTGIPKGGQDPDETIGETAIRELEEETGIKISKDILELPTTKKISMYMYAWYTYYIVETEECFPVELRSFAGNDVSGVGWVHPECLSKLPGRTTGHLRKIVKIVCGVNVK